MKRLTPILILLLLLLLCSPFAHAQKKYAITNFIDEYHLTDENIVLLVDSSNALSFEEVSLKINEFKPRSYWGKSIENCPYTVWITFVLEDKSDKNSKWIFQAPLHSQTYEMYIPEEEGRFKIVRTGQSSMFFSREYQIRALAFDLPLRKNEPMRFFARIKSDNHLDYSVLISNQKHYTDVLVNGYIFLGINYGIIFLMALYNFILYLSIRDKVYVYYIAYTLCAASFMTWKDGIGFQYIWNDHPGFNIYHHRISLFLMLVFATIFVRNFLGDHIQLDKRIKIALWSLLGISSVQFLISMFIPGYFDSLPITHFATWLFLYGIIIYSLAKGYKPSRYALIGHTFILTSLITIKLRYMGVLPWSWFDEYIINFSTIIECVVMSLAIRDKITLLRKDKEQAQVELIQQLKDNEELKDKVNKELESKVRERTSELQHRTEELGLAKEKLQIAMGKLEEMSVKLDLDNWKLKKKVQNERMLRVSEKEIVTYQEFLELFPNENSCFRYIEGLKWGEDGSRYICNRCNNKKFGAGNQSFSKKCSRCNYIETITSHTLFHGIKFPIEKAFYIAYITLRNENISSEELSKSLDLRRDTCWKFKRKVLERRDEMKVKLKVSAIVNLDQIIVDVPQLV